MVCNVLVVLCAVVAALVLPTCSARAGEAAAALPPYYAGGYIGQLRQYKVRPKESLIEIARRFDLGYNEMRDANPGVDPILPKSGTVVTIPSAWIPPAVSERPSIVVNLAELRLFVFPTTDAYGVESYPIGIGDEGTDTPVGRFVIVDKILDPSWHVPASIRRQRPQLPAVVAPGERNPLGRHALRLSRKEILIHGTNRPWGIGRRSSHGCLRLYPDDIASLFAKVQQGMRVWIINQPVKVGVKEGKVFIEFHHQDRDTVGVGDILHMLADQGLLQRVDMGKLVRAYYENKGYPVEITWTDP
ncbi:L,D-transpeptidase family protein [Geomonas sp. Red69]|uniref:L,D-transpeptidase family protein n=1 Tax=Geomonas diazotrophica TaxID=2843197 RepID=A0ABX8JE83_9BACT|nr:MULTISPECIES: L,D-transpeptidase family protein [Geomonas]MBU5638823.1 L,D-transpeptidase family protein [Geomonas diazotrophica]QWV96618.1 L,D-transpeptidase family protein [Geomonas nitrogeniifigens]QXE85720.1 L,D-transpeptidase family protein [Geomonas nitrogeniifigens]